MPKHKIWFPETKQKYRKLSKRLRSESREQRNYCRLLPKLFTVLSRSERVKSAMILEFSEVREIPDRMWTGSKEVTLNRQSLLTAVSSSDLLGLIHS